MNWEELKAYYMDKVYLVGMPPFENLSKRQMKKLENSTGLAIWRVGQALEDFRKEMYIHLEYHIFLNFHQIEKDNGKSKRR